MIVELTGEQRDTLLDVLNRERMEIGPETHHSWRRDYRTELKDRKRILLSLRELLSDVPVEPTTAG